LILVSGCLLGICCRYDGLSRPDDKIIEMASFRRLLPVCPEQLGGLPTPRSAAYLCGGDGFKVLEGSARVLTVDEGRDVTEQFLKGARECQRLATIFGAREAILKDKSPSCGLTDKVGVTAAALILSGVKVTEAG